MYITGAPRKDINGFYAFTEELHNRAPVYYCEETKSFLLRNERGMWVVTDKASKVSNGHTERLCSMETHLLEPSDACTWMTKVGGIQEGTQTTSISIRKHIAVGERDPGFLARSARAKSWPRRLAIYNIYDIGFAYPWLSTLWHAGFHALLWNSLRDSETSVTLQPTFGVIYAIMSLSVLLALGPVTDVLKVLNEWYSWAWLKVVAMFHVMHFAVSMVEDDNKPSQIQSLQTGTSGWNAGLAFRPLLLYPQFLYYLFLTCAMIYCSIYSGGDQIIMSAPSDSDPLAIVCQKWVVGAFLGIIFLLNSWPIIRVSALEAAGLRMEEGKCPGGAAVACLLLAAPLLLAVAVKGSEFHNRLPFLVPFVPGVPIQYNKPSLPGNGSMLALGPSSRIVFTVDVSSIGCGCTAALYLVSASPMTSNCTSAAYCDANFVDGCGCEEIDLFEGNLYDLRVAVHACDGTKGACDGDGCAVRMSSQAPPLSYGPGQRYKINTLQPFAVEIRFIKSPTDISLWTILTQGPDKRTLTLRLSDQTCEHAVLAHSRPSSMLPRLTHGLRLAAALWGDPTPAKAADREVCQLRANQEDVIARNQNLREAMKQFNAGQNASRRPDPIKSSSAIGQVSESDLRTRRRRLGCKWVKCPLSATKLLNSAFTCGTA